MCEAGARKVGQGLTVNRGCIWHRERRIGLELGKQAMVLLSQVSKAFSTGLGVPLPQSQQTLA